MNWFPCRSFYNDSENANYLFFSCVVAKVARCIIGSCVEANSCPSNVCQCLAWLYAYMLGDKKFFALLTVVVF
jgi:hypothetical protein